MLPLLKKNVKYIVIHHSESTGGDVLFIRKIHVDDNGWSDVGYHYVIPNGKKNGDWGAGQDGALQTGRPRKYIGAHARGYNTESLGICLIGRFGEHNPTKAQISRLINLCVALCKEYQLPASAIVGHYKLCNTDCPAKNMKRLLPIIRIVVKWLLKKRRAGKST